MRSFLILQIVAFKMYLYLYMYVCAYIREETTLGRAALIASLP